MRRLQCDSLICPIPLLRKAFRSMLTHGHERAKQSVLENCFGAESGIQDVGKREALVILPPNTAIYSKSQGKKNSFCLGSTLLVWEGIEKEVYCFGHRMFVGWMRHRKDTTASY